MSYSWFLDEEEEAEQLIIELNLLGEGDNDDDDDDDLNPLASLLSQNKADEQEAAVV